ncbi:glutathione S-transferase [Defluviimonas salinarum]|uniref:Glutathione S-transferase n=1 Tax=Defluviimonas salinarum TaxID=2992147 RepID=A0ABT3IYG5_9RHOB|nr:glutathione S-transferase [Defluviimonas salinarum]MCW3780470.1 glutathione S-transferase [Defluviimonas salinarum]
MDYTLYYWPLPFRGHFVRYVLAHAGASWDEGDTAELIRLKALPVGEQPTPFMAPPLLNDHAAGLWLSQLPAILLYLGRKHDLLPEDSARAALAHKLVCDANDVLEEITCNCGRTMWAKADWDDFAATRLPRWMAIFEDTGRRHGLTAEAGTMLGTGAPGLADLAAAALWHTMGAKLPLLGGMLRRNAPRVAALSQRIAALPEIAAMIAREDARTGRDYCGGQIERSLRAMLEETDHKT